MFCGCCVTEGDYVQGRSYIRCVGEVCWEWWTGKFHQWLYTL